MKSVVCAAELIQSVILMQIVARISTAADTTPEVELQT